MFQEENNVSFLVRHRTFISFTLLFVISLLFLEADPSAIISEFSRDALTDEGLYTSQIRNFYLFGTFYKNESDAFLKAPFLSFWMLPSYLLFGVKIFTSRLWMLIGAFFLFLLKSKLLAQHKNILAFYVGLTLLNVYLFQYIHFTMSDYFCAEFIIIGILLLSNYLLKNNLSNIIFSASLFWICFLFKIQFIYITLPFIVLSFFVLIYKRVRKHIIYFILFNLVVLLLVFVFWYLPNRDSIEILSSIQQHAGSPFLNPFKDYYFIYYQFKYYFLSFENFSLLILFLFSLILYVVNYKNIRLNKFLFNLSNLTLIWIFMELHKFIILYLPARYLVSFIVAIGLFISIQLYFLFKEKSLKHKVYYHIAIFMIGVTIVINIIHISLLIANRTYQVKKINELVSKKVDSNRPILGQWAASLAQESKAHIISFSFISYFDKDYYSKNRPKIIIKEEHETDYFYLKQEHLFKSKILKTTKIKVGKYPLEILELK